MLNALTKGHSRRNPQITQMKQQLTQMQQTYEQQIQELKNQNLLLKAQAISTDARNKDTLAKAEMDNATRILIEQLKQHNENARQDKEIVKDSIDKVEQIEKELM